MIDIKIKRLHKDAKLPTRATAESAGYDLYAVEPLELTYANQTAIVATGISVEIPPGYELQIRPRSGLAAKFGLMVTNSPGTIDSDYRGEIKVLVTRIKDSSNPALQINPGDRIAQMVLAVVPQSQIVEVVEVSCTDRGAGGFGSTGA